MEPLKKQNSILYNQEWINKAIEEGHIDFLPTRKPFNNKSIGELIAIKYRQICNEELEKACYNNSLEEFHHLHQNSPKITIDNSLLLAQLQEADSTNIPNNKGYIKKRKKP